MKKNYIYVNLYKFYKLICKFKFIIIIKFFMSKIEKYKSIQNELLETFIKKNNDYGNDNLDTFGKIGIMIRLHNILVK